MRIALITVNYRKAARVVESIQSLRRQSVRDAMKIVVVDNSESAAEADVLRRGLEPGEDLAVLPRNLGYTRGVNVGAAAAGAFDFVILVNPDIIVDDIHSVEKMVGLMQAQPKIGVLATMQHNDDGSVVEVARRFPTPSRQVLRRIFPSDELSLLKPLQAGDAKRIADVDWVQSSFVMIRRAMWDAIGGLDERYFVFMADVALGLRARELGYRVSVMAGVDVRADGLRASRGGVLDVWRSKALRIHVRDSLAYYIIESGLMPRRLGKRKPDVLATM